MSSCDSNTGMSPTPSWARARSIDVSQSTLLGATFDGGVAGGTIPAAPAGATVSPAAMKPVIMMTNGSSSGVTRRRAR